MSPADEALEDRLDIGGRAEVASEHPRLSFGLPSHLLQAVLVERDVGDEDELDLGVIWPSRAAQGRLNVGAHKTLAHALAVTAPMSIA